MISNEKDAVNAYVEALSQLKTFNQENQNSMFVQFFMQNRYTEMVGILKRGTSENKTKALEIMQSLDPANSGKYNEALK
jgi:hypothetical protein